MRTRLFAIALLAALTTTATASAQKVAGVMLDTLLAGQHLSVFTIPTGGSAIRARRGLSTHACSLNRAAAVDWVVGSLAIIDTQVTPRGGEPVRLEGPLACSDGWAQITRTTGADTTIFQLGLSGLYGTSPPLWITLDSSAAERIVRAVGETVIAEQVVASQPVDSVRQPTWYSYEVDIQARGLPSNPQPLYPAELRSSHLSAKVLAQFIVDTNGRVDTSSFKVITSTHPLFSKAVAEVLRQYRFTPAEMHGRKVRQLVQESFQFVPPGG